ncbi:hypothetical protein [Jannaschia sp. CCS1]|uniref:hypothetical protein n=1 Tax=Jannaschia sp. (strain CCS1) TaxID=290400 RepID=UPI000053B7B7|nr:hypothetical protein [Jannaschia sp. CCS1]ABD52962.1 hypothetical protein Jann_0045 [Jannaschia sp. CCS1]
MSDHYLFHLTFDVRHDAPPQLMAALAKRAGGDVPSTEDMGDLPPIVQDYLRGGGVPGDGVYCFYNRGPRSKFIDGTLVEIGWEPHEGSHTLRMAQTFHDDEYWNGGLYYIHWLYQFVADDGPIGTMQQTNGNEPASILTKVGDDIIETKLAYNPGKYWPGPGQPKPDPDTPMIIEKSTAFPLSEMMEGLAMFADGHSYE